MHLFCGRVKSFIKVDMTLFRPNHEHYYERFTKFCVLARAMHDLKIATCETMRLVLNVSHVIFLRFSIIAIFIGFSFLALPQVYAG